jgi:hypothetical protein
MVVQNGKINLMVVYFKKTQAQEILARTIISTSVASAIKVLSTLKCICLFILEKSHLDVNFVGNVLPRKLT